MSFIKKTLIIACLFSFFSYGQVLVIQSSDHHSSYGRMSDFLASLEVLSRKFKKDHPKGKIVLFINGDFSSSNEVSNNDQANFDYDILSQLAEKYIIFYVFGNHDSFDWRDAHQLFISQMKKLKQAGVHLLATNVSFYSEHQDLFEPFFDISLEKNKKIRFAGFALPKTQQYRFFREQGSDQRIIRKIEDIPDAIDSLAKEVNQQEDIISLVVGMHLGFRRVKKIVSKLDGEIRKKIKVIFAAHDHAQKIFKIDNTQIIDSKDRFNFSKVVLNENGELVFKKFFDEQSQREIMVKMDRSSLEAQLIIQVNNHIKKI